MFKKGYDFDDVLLIPKPSRVNSRTEVDLSTNLGRLKLKLPIIASPMKGITGIRLIEKLSDLGGIGILHRFQDDFKTLESTIIGFKQSGVRFGISTGISDYYIDNLLDYCPDIICVDVANGYTSELLGYTHYLRTRIDFLNLPILLMAGNVATYDGAVNLKLHGADLIRVGIGSGKLCTTRNVTGIGIPQISAIKDCSQIDGYPLTRIKRIGLLYSDADDPDMPEEIVNSVDHVSYIVADGGIRNSGDAVKALAAGADVIMLGSLLAQTNESDHNGIIYGMASRKLQEEYYHSVKSVEGIELPAEKRISLEDFINEFTWGMKSAFTYLNSRNIKELHTNAEFVETGSGSIKSL